MATTIKSGSVSLVFKRDSNGINEYCLVDVEGRVRYLSTVYGDKHVVTGPYPVVIKTTEGYISNSEMSTEKKKDRYKELAKKMGSYTQITLDQFNQETSANPIYAGILNESTPKDTLAPNPWARQDANGVGGLGV